MKRVKKILIIAAICTFAASCSNVDKLLKSNDYDAKYAAAMRYYNDNQYSKAIQLFENLTLHYRGKENAEEIAWCYSQSLLHDHDYYQAAYQFKRFARQFPYSDHTEEAAYLSAYCRYMQSPDYSLDQTVTRQAIEEFEIFAERWPRSIHIPEVNHYLDELREKLMLKEYEIGVGYYTIEEYSAAYESLKSFLNYYPDAPMREDAMFYMLRSGYRYAIGSREEKKHERLQQVVNDFERFSGSITNAKHLAEAQDIYTRVRAALTDMEKAALTE